MSVTAEAAHLLAAKPRMSEEDARDWLAERSIRLSLPDVRLAQEVADALRGVDQQFAQFFAVPRLEVRRG